jgi:hypothetical protein
MNELYPEIKNRCTLYKTIRQISRPPKKASDKKISTPYIIQKYRANLKRAKPALNKKNNFPNPLAE